MKKQRTIGRQVAATVLAVLAVFGWAVGLAGSAAQPAAARVQTPDGTGKKVAAQAPTPLPPEIVKAWQDAGAKAGWMRVNLDGYLEFVHEEKGGPGDVPGFRFYPFKPGVLAKLPDPKRGFALDLRHTEVTDAGLKELAGLKSLQTLDLWGSKVTDAGLKELAGLKSLQTLELRNTQVTDAGLKELARLKSLQSLNLWGTKVTDAGLKELAGLKSLQLLALGDTKVTDAGLKELAGLKSLQLLALFRTHVTDAGLKELAGLKSLQTLSLESTKVTDAGIAALQKELPECRITR